MRETLSGSDDLRTFVTFRSLTNLLPLGTSDSPSTKLWIVAVSAAAVVILVAAGIGIYVFRDKLRRLKPRIR